jgi:Protein of unknown function (DUF1592)/Protein of unknown function (DUF1588)/Protein of unknown function (DUF1595)/Protein of unknown function (DUF1587)/Protein of unknown function (DUF1585)
MRKGLLVAALAALGCTAELTGPQGNTTTGGPGVNNANGGSGAGGGGTTTPQNVAPDCMNESPSPRILRQLTRAEYGATVGDLLGLQNPDITAIPPDTQMRGFSNNVAVSFVDDQHLDAYSSVAKTLATKAITDSYAKLVPCATEDNACAASFIDSFGLHAFRRPLSDPEKARYLALFDPAVTAGQFKTGVELTIRALLVSPSFLFRSELGKDDGKGNFVLTPYEIASALSYLFVGSMPDAPLFASAASGALANKTEMEAQARRLLADPRGRSQIAHFFYEWLESPRAYVATKDAAAFPKLFATPTSLDTIKAAMREEQDQFVTHVVFDSTKHFDELFNATYTYANADLAAYYGLPGSVGPTTQKVDLGADSPRGGLLTLGMFLFGHARTTASSPTQRGHMIRANLLCNDIPPPPANVDTAISPAVPGNTTREQILSVTGNGVCPSCHTLQDPIGFGLEGFDGAGVGRTMDNGEAVDTSGAINGMTGPMGEALTFNGPRELSTVVAKNPHARSCFTTNYYRFARGYDAKGVDTCAVNKLTNDLVSSDLELPQLFIKLALQDSFSQRRSADVVDP